MRVGFDAKRAFFNKSGLGNYSRDTISIMSKYFPMNEYVLYTPKPSKSTFFSKQSNISIVGPEKKMHQLFTSFWRTYRLSEQLVNDKIQLFHGLSNELPKGIEHTKIPSIVTVHDIIFMRYPDFYKSVDRNIYEKKTRYAAQRATRVIAVSQQTKDDLVNFFGIPETKIDVVYQGCNPIYWEPISRQDRISILMNYAIPEKFILYVGTIEERKNLLNIIKAIDTGKIDYPLVVVGKPTSYYSKIQSYIKKHNLKNIYILNNVTNEDLPAFYQQSSVFVYPSLFEGFGIPIIEALTSKTPVITSTGGCFPEAGGKSSIYVDPFNIEELAAAIKKVLGNNDFRNNMIIDGYVHAQKFSQEKIASNILDVYEKVR